MTHTKEMMTLTGFDLPMTASGLINTQKALHQLLARPPHAGLGLCSAWDDAGGDSDAFFAPIAGEGHAGYVAHRDAIKGLICTLAQNQKTLSTRMRAPGGDSAAQFAHAMGARAVTMLIEIRRSGKRWSAVQRSKCHEIPVD